MRRAVLLAALPALSACASAPTAPRAAIAYAELGRAKLVLKQDYRGAVADLTRAIELDPDEAGPYVLRGLARRRLGEQDAAEADFRKAASLDSSLKGALRTLDR